MPAGSRASLLFVARRPPFPLVNGARIRTHRLLTGLARDLETTFVTFEHDPASPDGHMSRRALEEELSGIRIVTVPGCGPGKRLRQARTLGSDTSWEYGRYDLPALRTALEELVARDHPRIVHFDDLGVAQHGPFAGALNVYSAHNIEFRILEGTAESSHGLRNLFARIERRKVESLERRAWTTMDLCLACSDLDADELRAGGARVLLCPNGTDPVGVLPPPRRSRHEPLRLLFVGSGAYRPNQLGLEWFIERVLPLIRGRVPVALDVVGSPPKKLPQVPEVVVHGTVASLEPFYRNAHVAIVPVLYGSGTRLKIIESMAYGRPVVSTAAGAEGLPIAAGTHFVEADSPADFAAALLAVAAVCERGSGRLAEMLELAREAASRLFWPHIVEKLSQSYREYSATLGSPAPARLSAPASSRR
jgi:glycosyltransferase involved in cell wall biosynthesis